MGFDRVQSGQISQLAHFIWIQLLWQLSLATLELLFEIQAKNVCLITSSGLKNGRETITRKISFNQVLPVIFDVHQDSERPLKSFSSLPEFDESLWYDVLSQIVPR